MRSSRCWPSASAAASSCTSRIEAASRSSSAAVPWGPNSGGQGGAERGRQRHPEEAAKAAADHAAAAASVNQQQALQQPRLTHGSLTGAPPADARPPTHPHPPCTTRFAKLQSSAYISAEKLRRLRSTMHRVPYRMPSAGSTGGRGRQAGGKGGVSCGVWLAGGQMAMPAGRRTGWRSGTQHSTQSTPLTPADQGRAGVKLDEGRPRDIGVCCEASILRSVLRDEHCRQARGQAGRQAGSPGRAEVWRPGRGGQRAQGGAGRSGRRGRAGAGAAARCRSQAAMLASHAAPATQPPSQPPSEPPSGALGMLM
jgi:hypothetical protein